MDHTEMKILEECFFIHEQSPQKLGDKNFQNMSNTVKMSDSLVADLGQWD